MASSLATVQYICDQAGLGPRLGFRKMFGEYALYLEGKVIALVCDDQLFLKPTAEGRAFLGAVPEAPPYPGCKPFPVLSAELDDPERLAQALEITARALPMPKAKTKAKAKVATEAAAKTAKTVNVKLESREGMSAIPVEFDPKAVFGKVRAPVKVTLNGYSYRSTIAAMGGKLFIPLRKSHREAAGIGERGTIKVRIEPDGEERKVSVPPALKKALAGSKRAAASWRKLSYTSQREYAEAVTGAKKPETRERRIARILDALKAGGTA